MLMFIYFNEIYKTKNYCKYRKYWNKYRVWTFLMKNKGSYTSIYYSKDNPNIIRDKFKMTTTIFATIFISIFLLGINIVKKVY